jgi:hypothetical protein
MKNRTEIFVKSGSETRSRMSKAMTPPESLALERQLAWQPQAAPVSPAGRPPPTAALLTKERQLRTDQAARLAARRAEVAVQIETGVTLAVERIAGLRGILVHFAPAGASVGADLTESFRPELRAMFEEKR